MTKIQMGTSLVVDKAIEEIARGEAPRKYLGASVIGEECLRKLWYGYHEPLPITDPRVNRIFQLGDAVEDLVVKWLKQAGFTVYDVDDNGKQFRFEDGEVKGHADGVIMGIPESDQPHLLEIKSANDKRFKKFQKEGYKTDEKYWTQVHVMAAKLNLKKILVVIMNKDTCELYFQRIDTDKRLAERRILRAKEVAKLEDPPERAYPSSTFYKCKWCDYREKCWDD